VFYAVIGNKYFKEITKRITATIIKITAEGLNFNFESYSSLKRVRPPPKPNGIVLSAIFYLKLFDL
jgi:hypothetical protein